MRAAAPKETPPDAANIGGRNHDRTKWRDSTASHSEMQPGCISSRATQPWILERGDHAELAEMLLEDLRAEAPVVYTEGAWWSYDCTLGIFARVEPPRLSAHLQGYAGRMVSRGENKPPSPLRLNANDVRGAIKLASDLAFEGDFFASATRGVVFADRFIDVTPDGIVTHPHSPHFRARFAYPFAFKAGASPDRFLRFLAEIWADSSLPEADAITEIEAKASLIQEFLGVCILGLATRFQKALVFRGDGANGKSALSAIVEACMPPGSVCSIPPQDMAQEYRRAMMAGKLLNIVAELPEADILDSESWKSTIAGDSTTGRPIRGEPFAFRPVAGHIYSANRLPGTTDQTFGFWRRMIVVSFPRIFRPEEQDPTLAERIIAAERPKIVSWALEGARRALAAGRYTIPPSASDEIERWKRAADQVLAFAEERLERLPLDASVWEWMPASKVYGAFREWTADNGHRPMAANKFGERMRLIGFEARKSDGVNRYPVRLRGVV